MLFTPFTPSTMHRYSQDAFISGMIYVFSRKLLSGAPYVPGQSSPARHRAAYRLQDSKLNLRVRDREQVSHLGAVLPVIHTRARVIKVISARGSR